MLNYLFSRFALYNLFSVLIIFYYNPLFPLPVWPLNDGEIWFNFCLGLKLSALISLICLDYFLSGGVYL